MKNTTRRDRRTTANLGWLRSTEKRRRSARALAAVSACVALYAAGCGGNSGGGGSSSNPFPSGYVTLSGNWEIQATPTSGAAPFTAMAGYINEEKTGYGNDVTTAALQVTPSTSSNCYAGATVVPMQGTTRATTITLNSFNDEQQKISLNATKNSTATGLTGTYSIAGGCADGATGTITGTQYAALTGKYAGTIDGSSPAKTVALTLTQYTTGTGQGNFLVSGSASFSGIACFTAATLAAANGSISGSAVSLTFTTNGGNGPQVSMTGTMDAAASTLTLGSIEVSGGGCAGSLGTATLTLQQ